MIVSLEAVGLPIAHSSSADKANSTELSPEGIELAWYLVIAGH